VNLPDRAEDKPVDAELQRVIPGIDEPQHATAVRELVVDAKFGTRCVIDMESRESSL